MLTKALPFHEKEGVENVRISKGKKVYRPGPVISGKLSSASTPGSLYFQVTSWYTGPFGVWCFL